MAAEPQVIAVCRKGSMLSLSLDAKTGDPSIVTAIEAGMRPCDIDDDGEPIFRRGSASIDLTAAVRAATSEFPAGWTISLNGAGTAQLAPGYYAVDAKLTYSGGVLITRRSAVIEIEESGV